MRPSLVLAAALGALLVRADLASISAADDPIAETTAQQHGLTRPWFSQVQMDRARSRVHDLILHDGILYVQTDRAMIHAIDAETGRSLWARMIGRPEHPSMTPGIGDDLMAVVNGSRLYVVNRYTGDLLYETEVEGAPGAGPAVSRKRAYVPMVNGMIMAYRIEPLTDPLKELGKLGKPEAEMTEEEKKAAEEERRQDIRVRQDYVPPMACHSAGRALVQPVVTMQNADEEFAAWTTDRGYLNVGRIDRRMEDKLLIKYRLLTGAPIEAQPTYLPPNPKMPDDVGTIFAGSRDGYVYALVERSGEQLWKFSAGEPILEPPAVIEQRVFVCTQLSGMFCLDAKNGRQQWWAPEIVRFLAAGKLRVYAADRRGRIVTLDAKTGTRLDVLPYEGWSLKLTNTDTDRIYVGTDTGLVQCLREIDQVQPIPYGESRKLPKEKETPKALPKYKLQKEDRDMPKEKAAPKTAKAKAPAKAAAPKAGAKKKGKKDDADAGNNPLVAPVK
ncbi:MAG: PQQ-binding-like beta-propeller repeat protein [Thermoguttaceae bacterium]|jgi:outer membrane protein assembly factor BamB